MPRRRIDPELKYVDASLQPVITALRKNKELRDDFLHFSHERNADLTTQMKRLEKLRFLKRPQLTAYFVIVLIEFGQASGLLTPPQKAKGTEPAGRRRR